MFSTLYFHDSTSGSSPHWYYSSKPMVPQTNKSMTFGYRAPGNKHKEPKKCKRLFSSALPFSVADPMPV